MYFAVRGTFKKMFSVGSEYFVYYLHSKELSEHLQLKKSCVIGPKFVNACVPLLSNYDDIIITVKGSFIHFFFL